MSVTLKNEQGNVSVVKNADLDVLGAVFREVTDAQKSQLNIKYGVEVVKVNNGKLKDAGMGKGYIITHVNDTSIKTLDDLAEIVKSASTSKDPVLYIKGIYPTGRKTYYAVPLSE